MPDSPIAATGGRPPAERAGAPVPRWPTAPVLRIAIPDSPFGPRRSAPDAAPAPKAIEPAAAIAERPPVPAGPETASPAPEAAAVRPDGAVHVELRARPAATRPRRRPGKAVATVPRTNLPRLLAAVGSHGAAAAPSPPAGARPTLAPEAVPETRPLAQNRRLYRRVILAAEIEIDGVRCRLIDLSVGGFAAAGSPNLTANTVVPVTLRMNIDGIDIGSRFSARVIYAGAARSAARFVDLTGAQTAFLRYVVTWRGETVGAVGTTALLEAITHRPQPAPPPAAAPEPPTRASRWSRWFGRIPLLGRRHS